MVYFKNANIPQTSAYIPFNFEYVPLNPKFITYWSDDEIRISTIPSIGYSKNGTNSGLDRITGSGQILVERVDKVRRTSSASLTVRYAIANHIVLPIPWQTDPELQQYYEIHNHDFVNDSPNDYDFEFVYDPEFYENKPAYTAFHRALEIGRCATGINFKQL